MSDNKSKSLGMGRGKWITKAAELRKRQEVDEPSPSVLLQTPIVTPSTSSAFAEGNRCDDKYHHHPSPSPNEPNDEGSNKEEVIDKMDKDLEGTTAGKVVKSLDLGIPLAFQALDIGEKTSESGEEEHKEGWEMNAMELAKDFRDYATLSSEFIPEHYFCSVCGEFCGKDGYACENYGHVTCRECANELRLPFCLYLLPTDDNGNKVCQSNFLNIKSVFHHFMFDKIKIKCIARSCTYTGTGEIVKAHQSTCQFVDSDRNQGQ